MNFLSLFAGLLPGLIGIEIYESPLMMKRDRQIRFPIHRKRRVLKKWAARDCNWKWKPMAYQAGNKVYCHPTIARLLRENIEANTELRQAPHNLDFIQQAHD